MLIHHDTQPPSKMEGSRKIFGIGLSRTGTTTLSHILRKLGLKTKHSSFRLLGSPDWSEIDEYDAFCDTPIPMLYQECDKRFPESKFILTIRDKNSWLSSMEWMFTHGKVIWNWQEPLHRYHEAFYKTASFNKVILERHWDDYHNSVTDYFKHRSEDLMVINLDKGFDLSQICSFLAIDYREIDLLPQKNTRRFVPFHKRLRYNMIHNKPMRTVKNLIKDLILSSN